MAKKEKEGKGSVHYHSTMSRRDFIKVLGLGGATAGVAAVASPVFGDLDEVMASSAAERKLPSWVREVDKPTVEIDWSIMKRFDARKTMFNIPSFLKAVGEDEGKRLLKLRGERMTQYLRENRPGFGVKDQALYSAARLNMFHHFPPSQLSLESVFLGPRMAPTPEAMGVPRWKGTPEEATRMVRAAAKLFGAAEMGVTEFNEKTRKLFYSYDAAGNTPNSPPKKVEFENVDQAYETDKKRVIPYNMKSVIDFAVRMSPSAIATSPSIISDAGIGMGYSEGYLISSRLQEFLRGLGYQCLAESNINGSLANSGGFAVLSGLGELSRLNRVITPEYGPTVRIFKVVTDLPMAPTKPIDAGIMRFCRTCKLCAEACPNKALSMDAEPSWETKGYWNNPGVKAYYEDASRCRTTWMEVVSCCAICFAVCPFANINGESFAHDMVAKTIAATPAFNGLITDMDVAFGYGQKDPEKWWDKDLPPYGYSSGQKI